LFLSIYYGNHTRDEMFRKTTDSIEKNENSRRDQLDRIAAKLNMSIMDNHNFMKSRIIEMVTAVNGINDRVGILEEKVKEDC
jgi:hypothetical protein